MLRGEVFLGMMRNYRIMWVGGRYGGGKTSFIVRIGYEFVKRGWANQIVANFPCVLATDIGRAGEVKDTVILADEAGIWINEKTFGEVTAYLRKYNLYLFMASVLPVPIRARSLNVQRELTWSTVGVPLWRYSCILDYMRVKEKFSISWFNPGEIFGLYDTSYPAGDDAGIVDWVNSVRKDSTRKVGGHSPSISVSSGDGNEELDAFRWIAEMQYEASQKMEEALSLSGHKTRKRGR